MPEVCYNKMISEISRPSSIAFLLVLVTNGEVTETNISFLDLF